MHFFLVSSYLFPGILLPVSVLADMLYFLVVGLFTVGVCYVDCQCGAIVVCNYKGGFQLVCN